MTSKIPNGGFNPENDDNNDNSTNASNIADTNVTTLGTATATTAPGCVPITDPETTFEPGETSDPTNVATEADPGDPDQDVDPPLTMAASVVLSSLPGDAKRALGQAVAEAEAVAVTGGPAGKGWC